MGTDRFVQKLEDRASVQAQRLQSGQNPLHEAAAGRAMAAETQVGGRTDPWALRSA